MKYPVMFRKADLVLLTKMDLLPHLRNVDVRAILDGITQVMPANRVIQFSAETGQGVDQWLAWLEEQRRAAISHVQRHAHAHAHAHQ